MIVRTPNASECERACARIHCFACFERVSNAASAPYLLKHPANIAIEVPRPWDVFLSGLEPTEPSQYPEKPNEAGRSWSTTQAHGGGGYMGALDSEGEEDSDLEPEMEI